MIKEPITDKIQTHSVSFGCDPEFFFEKKGQIVGSEKVIDINKGMKSGNSKFIVDGVQAELNPIPNTCRQNLANEISSCFRTLAMKMSTDKELSINFAPTVKITKKELESLDEKSRVFGCMPSKNTDKNAKNAVSTKDPSKYKYRSAGGHIHLGYVGAGGYNPVNNNPVKSIMKEPERLVQIMDIIVGNTCVLIDRDPGNKERRKTYGRAGEFRTPSYGVEYRTLSNFWLRAYPLMSLVMSLSRFSVSIMANSMPGRDYEKELLETVDIRKVKKAINTNNFELAWENFQKIKPFIMRTTTEDQNYPLTYNSLKAFEFFVEKGLDYWFKEDPLQHWINLPNTTGTHGWENYIRNVVTPKMIAERPTPAPKVK